MFCPILRPSCHQGRYCSGLSLKSDKWLSSFSANYVLQYLKLVSVIFLSISDTTYIVMSTCMVKKRTYCGLRCLCAPQLRNANRLVGLHPSWLTMPIKSVENSQYTESDTFQTTFVFSCIKISCMSTVISRFASWGVFLFFFFWLI